MRSGSASPCTRRGHENQYPPNLAVLVDKGLIEDAGTLVDPADNEPQAIGDTGVVTSYDYVGLLPEDVDTSVIVCYTRKGVRPEGRYVLSMDMMVELVTEDDLHDAEGPVRMSLRASYDAVVKAYGDKLTDGRKAELRRFYEIEE